jgi:hypothetical protein
MKATVCTGAVTIEVQYDLVRMKAKDAAERKKSITTKKINFFAAIVKKVADFCK